VAGTGLADLERKIEHVLDPGMRRGLALEVLRSLPADELYALLSRVLDRGPSPDGSPFDRLRDAVHGAVLAGVADGSLSYELRREIYVRAAEADDEVVMRVLRTLPPADEAAPPLDPELADIPLGRRRSLARGDDQRLLEKLARDSDAVVVRHLLANPRLREADVLRIAALRPVRAATLEEIERHPRWWQRARVRAALARNPYCPVQIALRAVETLSLSVLREMRRDPDLHPELLRHVEDEVARRARR
jgi:hypothetical protein